jgi:hypothetical protein
MAHARPLAVALGAVVASIAPSAATQTELPPLTLHELHAHRLQLEADSSMSVSPAPFFHTGVGGDLAYFVAERFAIGAVGRYWMPLGTAPTRPSYGPAIAEKTWSVDGAFTYVPFSTGRDDIPPRFPFDVTTTIAVGAISARPVSVVDPARRSFSDAVKVEVAPAIGARVFFTPAIALGVEVRDAIYAEDTERRTLSGHPSRPASWDGPTDVVNDVQVSLGLSLWLPTL